jgi:uncharacterized coiled-coil DUF342 family protein
MNRSILIVIVDFLLITLLAFSKFDDQDLDRDSRARPTPLPSASGEQDLMDVLRASLDKERTSREELNALLLLAQSQVQKRDRELQNRDQVLANREELIREAEQLLQQRAEEAARLERERSSLEKQFASNQSSISTLQRQLRAVLSEATQSKQQLDTLQQNLQTREQEEALLKRRLGELEQTRREAELQQQRLATQLQVAETEKRLFVQQLESFKGEVEVVRQEKAQLQDHATKVTEHATKVTEHATKLAEGVTSLAEKSGELTKEIRDNRPLAPNAVFNEFAANRVKTDFRAVRSGVFGREVNREKEAKTVLVQHGSQIYAIYHINDTPLSFSTPGMDWDWLIGNLRRGAAAVRIERMSFLAADPRVLATPISETRAKELGSKIYSIPAEPFKFQEAILVGADEGYYGECRFQLEPDNPQYVRMQRERFSWIMGKFAPSSGDLVFTKTGELLGLMVNKDYCLLLNEFAPTYHIQMGIGIGDQQTGLILSQLHGQVTRMPLKLQ